MKEVNLNLSFEEVVALAQLGNTNAKAAWNRSLLKNRNTLKTLKTINEVLSVFKQDKAIGNNKNRDAEFSKCYRIIKDKNTVKELLLTIKLSEEELYLFCSSLSYVAEAMRESLFFTIKEFQYVISVKEEALRIATLLDEALAGYDFVKLE